MDSRDLEEQFVDGLRTSVITLTRYVPKIPRRTSEHMEQIYFTPKKKNTLNKWVIVAIGTIAVVFFVGTMLIQRGA